jgi:hypothetical protein
MVAVDGEEEHVCIGNSFVGDTTTGVTNDDTPMDPVPVEVKEPTQSEEDLIGQMQTTIQLCLDLGTPSHWWRLSAREMRMVFDMSQMEER